MIGLEDSEDSEEEDSEEEDSEEEKEKKEEDSEEEDSEEEEEEGTMIGLEGRRKNVSFNNNHLIDLRFQFF
jgi:hypothetical protein